MDRGEVEEWSRHGKWGSCLPSSHVSASTNSLIVRFVCSYQLCCFLLIYVTVPASALYMPVLFSVTFVICYLCLLYIHVTVKPAPNQSIIVLQGSLLALVPPTVVQSSS